MAIAKDVADFLHRVIDHLPARESDKTDLHSELAVNTEAPAEKEDNSDASE